MVVPIAGRAVAAAVGALLVITATRSLIGTVIVPRPVGSWLTRWVDKIVNGAYIMLTNAIAKVRHLARRDPGQRSRVQDGIVKLTDDWAERTSIDQIFAGQASVILLGQLVAWVVIYYIGFTLLMWPFIHGGIATAFSLAGPGVFGSNNSRGAAERTIADLAAIAALITVTLQIAYLPTLYSAYNRRETEVALLNARAGVPSWGPELLARTHYALGSGASTIDTLPDLYLVWERWAADIAESHTTYLPLVRFRSPRPLSSWVTALLAILDSAALYLALSPGSAPVVPARLCLRSGFLCFRDVARAMGIAVPDEPDPGAGISLTYEEFLDAVTRMRRVDFPIERDNDLAGAWQDFVGWRVNYEQAAYALAYALDVVPALWSGPRRHLRAPIAPIRPPEGKPPK
jgi:hypothetical protein